MLYSTLLVIFVLYTECTPIFNMTSTCDIVKDMYQDASCCEGIENNVVLSQRIEILNGWVVNPYVTTYGGYDFTHVVVYNKKHDLTKARDVHLIWTGSSQFGSDTNYKVVYPSHITYLLQNVVSSNIVFAFVTTETWRVDSSAYTAHSLDYDTYMNITYPTPYDDRGYFNVGPKQAVKHLEHLKTYGYVAGSSTVTSSGLSDGGWLSSALVFMGIAHKAVCLEGFSSVRISDLVDKNISNFEIDYYTPNEDQYYSCTGVGAVYCDPGYSEHRRDAIQELLTITLGMNKTEEVYVTMSEFNFTKTVYYNADTNNRVNIYIEFASGLVHGSLMRPEFMANIYGTKKDPPSCKCQPDYTYFGSYGDDSCWCYLADQTCIKDNGDVQSNSWGFCNAAGDFLQ